MLTKPRWGPYLGTHLKGALRNHPGAPTREVSRTNSIQENPYLLSPPHKVFVSLHPNTVGGS